MSISSILIAAVLFMAVSPFEAAAIPGDFATEAAMKQKCSKGCVAGILVTAGVAAIFCSAVMCFALWPAVELTSRQEKRAVARKHIRERKEAEDEARAKNEALKDAE